MFSPFITYTENTQLFQLHDGSMNNQLVSIISVIDLKQSDFTAFSKSHTFTFADESAFGLFISNIIQAENGQKFRYLYLPPLNGRLEQKFQDLLASFCITLSNVCIFHMNSKYTRLAKNTTPENTPNTKQRSNYLILNSHGAQLYRVKIQTQSNKMQITDKVTIPQNQICPEQFLQNLSTSHKQSQINNILTQTLTHINSPKNLLTFEQTKITFLVKIRLISWLQENSQEYCKIMEGKVRLSVEELCKIQDDVMRYEIQQLKEIVALGLIYERYVGNVKKEIIDRIRQINQGLTLNYVLKIKEQYFPTQKIDEEQYINKFNQLQKTKQKIAHQLNRYKIDQNYSQIITTNNQISLYRIKTTKLQQQLQQKQHKILELENTIQQLNANIIKITDSNAKLSLQNYNFREINKAYESVCEELEQERQITRKNKVEIQSYIIEQKIRNQNQERLEGIIERGRDERNVLKKGMEHISAENARLMEDVSNLKNVIFDLEEKVAKFEKLQTKALQEIEASKNAKQQLQTYKKFSQQFTTNLTAFKNIEMHKINHILRRNYTKYQQKIQQNTKLQKQLQQKQEQKQELYLTIKQYEQIIKHCQQQIFREVSQNDMQADKNEREVLNYGDYVQ